MLSSHLKKFCHFTRVLTVVKMIHRIYTNSPSFVLVMHKEKFQSPFRENNLI